MKIALDVRRIRDFGVGTYIRNLLQALATAGPQHHYDLVCAAEDAPGFADLPSNFHTVPYARHDSARIDHLHLPRLIRSLRADLTHIPFHRVPLFMPRPYVVTIHDLSSLFFDDAAGLLHSARAFRLRRGLQRADGIIAVSGATQRDVASLVPESADRIRLIYNAPDPQFLQLAQPVLAEPPDPTPPPANATAFSNAIRFAIRSCSTPAPSGRRKTFRA